MLLPFVQAVTVGGLIEPTERHERCDERARFAGPLGDDLDVFLVQGALNGRGTIVRAAEIALRAVLRGPGPERQQGADTLKTQATLQLDGLRVVGKADGQADVLRVHAATPLGSVRRPGSSKPVARPSR